MFVYACVCLYLYRPDEVIWAQMGLWWRESEARCCRGSGHLLQDCWQSVHWSETAEVWNTTHTTFLIAHTQCPKLSAMKTLMKSWKVWLFFCTSTTRRDKNMAGWNRAASLQLFIDHTNSVYFSFQLIKRGHTNKGPTNGLIWPKLQIWEDFLFKDFWFLAKVSPPAGTQTCDGSVKAWGDRPSATRWLGGFSFVMSWNHSANI